MSWFNLFSNDRPRRAKIIEIGTDDDGLPVISLYDLLDGYYFIEDLEILLERKKLSISGQKDDLINRIIYESDYEPEKLLKKLSLERLKLICEDIDESKMGLKDDVIERIINHIDFEEEDDDIEVAVEPINVENSENKRVFIVHGHDDAIKESVARLIEKFGLEPIILHERVSSSRTIIEKLEAYSDVGFAIILLTPDDVGGKNVQKPFLKPRGRQNVIFEHGYFFGKLGRNRVCALLSPNVEKPSDIDGIVYISIDKRGAWKLDVAKELKASGYDIDMNSIQ